MHLGERVAAGKGGMSWSAFRTLPNPECSEGADGGSELPGSSSGCPLAWSHLPTHQLLGDNNPYENHLGHHTLDLEEAEEEVESVGADWVGRRRRNSSV